MNICTIRQNLVCLTKAIKANFAFALFTFSLTQNSIPFFSALLGESQPSCKTTSLGC